MLSIFVATFTYSTAGLFTVGVAAGHRVEDYPRLAVSFALVLLFVSLIMLVFFVHHLAHSIQIDEVMRSVERSTLRVIEHDLPSDGVSAEAAPPPPAWAVAVPAYQSGWVQTVRPDLLLSLVRDDVVAVVSTMVGEYVVEGAPLVWLSTPSPDAPPPDPAAIRDALPVAVRLGYERTAEQDVAFGVRQLADVAVKALSPAVNDPYTAIQALEHLGVLLAKLVRRPLGTQRLCDNAGTVRVVVPGRDLSYYLDLATGQIRRYGCAEPRVDRALLRVLATTGRFCDDPEDRRLIARHVQLVVDDAQRTIRQPADLEPVRAHAAMVLSQLGDRA